MSKAAGDSTLQIPHALSTPFKAELNKYENFELDKIIYIPKYYVLLVLHKKTEL